MSSIEEPEQYDLISLGSGEAGKFIGWTSATQGKKSLVVDRRWLGGSCPNVACLPSKNVIWSAKVDKLASQGQLFGLGKDVRSNEGKADMLEVKQRKNEMIDGLMDFHRANFKRTGAEFTWGEGKFVGPKTIQLTGTDGSKRYVKGDNIVLCTGSRAKIGDIPGLKESNPLTHIELLDIEEVPSHLIIFGGGYIGLEFASAMSRFGAKVTVLEHNKRILKHEDEDVAASLRELLEGDGVVFSTSTSITEVSGTSRDSVILKGTKVGEPFEVKGSHILCATGRTPNNAGIGLDIAGVELTKDGHISVDEWNRTTADGIFAVGDCSGSPHFTHVAYDDFRIVRTVLSNKANFDEKRRSTRQVPYVLFTDPELAHVGLHEEEAKAKGIKYRLAKLPMANFFRTRTIGEPNGLAKLLVSNEYDTILGFTALGPGVGELLPFVQLAMKKGVPYSDIGEMVLVHPTLSEGLMFLFSAVPPKS